MLSHDAVGTDCPRLPCSQFHADTGSLGKVLHAALGGASHTVRAVRVDKGGRMGTLCQLPWADEMNLRQCPQASASFMSKQPATIGTTLTGVRLPHGLFHSAVALSKKNSKKDLHIP